MEEQIQNQNKPGIHWVWYLVILVVILVGGYVAYRLVNSKQSATTEEQSSSATSEKQEVAAEWQEAKVAIAGKYADSDIVALADGTYRMYYSAEPEVQGFNGQVYSAVSNDGISWTQEPSTRIEGATFPDVIKLPDGSWRMYYQSGGVIKSASSADGLTFTTDPGTRISNSEEGYTLDNIGSSSTMILDDGSYLMIYRGTINQAYTAAGKVPNDTTQIYFYATSTDGLTFSKKGLAFDSQNNILMGLADGGDLVKWDDGTIRAYFWSYTGVYYVTYKNDAFSSDPVLTLAASDDPSVSIPPNPPSDPTLLNIDGTWFMYYGVHTKGIYYTTLTD